VLVATCQGSDARIGGLPLAARAIFFGPVKIGTQAGGKVAPFTEPGLDSRRGLTVGVVRRIREHVHAGLGRLALGSLGARTPREGVPSHPRLAGQGHTLA
jgi:hypothetical protein